MKISYAYVSGYASEDTGELMNINHPTIIVLDGEKRYLFPFTSEEHYGINEKGFMIKNDGFFNTKIRNQDELCDTIEYYKTLGKWRYAESLKIGDRCEHYVKGHISYLSENIPLLSNEEIKIKYIPVKHRATDNPKYIEICNENRKFEFQAFKIIEKAIFMNKIKCYETSNKPFENFMNVELKLFSIKEKVDICLGLRAERAFLEKTPCKDKIEYIEMIEKNKTILKLSTQDLKELDSYKKELIEERKTEQEEKLAQKIENLESQKVEIMIKGNTEEYKELKQSIEKLKGHLCDKKIDNEELTEKFEEKNYKEDTKNEDKIGNIYTEKSEN